MVGAGVGVSRIDLVYFSHHREVNELDTDSAEVECWRGHQRSMQHGIQLDLILGVSIIFAINIVIVIYNFAH